MPKNLLFLGLFLILSCISQAQETVYNNSVYLKAYQSTDSIPFQLKLSRWNKQYYNCSLILLDKQSSDTNHFVINPISISNLNTGISIAFKQLTDQSIDMNQLQKKKILTNILLNDQKKESPSLAGKMYFKTNVPLGYLVKYNMIIDEKEKAKDLVQFIPFDAYQRNHAIYNADSSRQKNAGAKYWEYQVLAKCLQEVPLNVFLKLFSSKDYRHKKKVFEVYEAKPLTFSGNKAQVLFDNGFIQKIIIEGKIGNEDIVFENYAPIGFSSTYNQSMLGYHKMNADYWVDHQKIKLEATSDRFISYVKQIHQDTRNYCPADIKVSLDFKETTSVDLYNEHRYNILNGKIFSDLTGLQEDNPNGIIQLEVDKRIDIITSRFYRNPKLSVGVFQYIQPIVVLSKLEEKDKYLELLHSQKDISNNTILDLYEYENFRAGTSFNMLYLDVNYAKTILSLNGGLYFGRVNFSDTLIDQSTNVNKHTINTMNLNANIRFDIVPKQEYGISFIWGASYYRPFSNELKQYVNPHNIRDENEWLQTSEILAYYRLKNTNSNVFFRYRFNSSLTNWNDNFSQVQLGYSFSISEKLEQKQVPGMK